MNEPPSSQNWFAVNNLDEVESPTLLIYPDRVEANIQRMIALAGSADRLRPHVKTHKLGQITTRQINAGITEFKAATLAEAQMCARAGAADVLLAYQPVGPNAPRFLDLIRAFPQTTFSCLLDDLGVGHRLSDLATAAGIKINILLDLDTGQHRTGLPPGEPAIELYHALCRLPGLNPLGLHAYDGHAHASDPAQREADCEATFAPVEKLRQELLRLGLPVKIMVAGGTPTLPFHARRPEVQCSPGTCVLWDAGYQSKFPDLNFQFAALLLTRVISKPGPGKLCLDLGHKAVASENPPPRVQFLNLPEFRFIAHSEEHLVIETSEADRWRIGDALIGVPWHICPTVALHGEAVVVRGNQAVDRWRIHARDRRLDF
jgi:D-serine deaminase-like pyridoxal phosphate-dependent protein